MIEGIEISPSDRARCKGGCGKIIGKGTPRGIETSKQSYGISYTYFCYKCTKRILKEQIEHTKELQEELEKDIKEHKKEIIVMEL